MAHTRHKPGAFALVLTIFLGLFTTVHAHSCVERLMRIAYNGSMVGTPGFARGFVDRNDGGDFDNRTIWKILPPIESSALAHPSQRTSNYSQQFPPLTAAPGDLIALQYQENGHVTKFNGQPNKPKNRGTVYIYGTSQEVNPDTMLLDVHYQWNAKGTGGDRKGKLLATRNFDDGQCYEGDNGQQLNRERREKFPKAVEQPMGDRLWCQTDLALPDDLEVGKPYTLLWVWDWPYMNIPDVPFPPASPTGPPGSYVFPGPPGANGSRVETPEIYTTVMDINIVDSCDQALGGVKGPGCKTNAKISYQPLETDLNKASIAEQCKNNFLVDVSGNFNGSSPEVLAPGSAPAPGPASSKSANPSASPSASSSASPSDSASAPAHHSGNGRTKTVIETVPYTTVTVTVQPTEDATTSSDASATSTSSDTSTAVTSSQSAQTTGSKAYGAEAPAVTPVTAVTRFMTSSQVGAKKIRREAGAWTFGHG